MTGHAEAAIPVFERLAESDHREAIAMLAYAYRDGKGVAVDHERAAYWLGRAAALGDERAAHDLAVYRARRGDADA
jgi:localization factor PodJL